MSILSPETAFTTLQAAQTQKPADVLKSFENDTQAKNARRIKETAEDFEAVFLAEMLKPMFEGIDVEEPFNGGKGEEIFRGMMLQEYGKEIAKNDITGIQTQVMNKLIEMQGQRTEEDQSPALQSKRIIDVDVIEE